MQNNKEDLYRRLAQLRRVLSEPLDPLTQERLRAHALDLERQLAALEVRDTDAPPD